jgi:hypothetical protein
MSVNPESRDTDCECNGVALPGGELRVKLNGTNLLKAATLEFGN